MLGHGYHPDRLSMLAVLLKNKLLIMKQMVTGSPR